jgi:hypothetical protein
MYCATVAETQRTGVRLLRKERLSLIVSSSLITLIGVRNATGQVSQKELFSQMSEGDLLRQILRLGLNCLREHPKMGSFTVSEPTNVGEHLRQLESLDVLDSLLYPGLREISVDQLLIQCDSASRQHILTLLILGEVFELYEEVTGVEYDVEHFMKAMSDEPSPSFKELCSAYLQWCRSIMTD